MFPRGDRLASDRGERAIQDRYDDRVNGGVIEGILYIGGGSAMSCGYDQCFRSTNVDIASGTKLASVHTSKTLSADQTAADYRKTGRRWVHPCLEYLACHPTKFCRDLQAQSGE